MSIDRTALVTLLVAPAGTYRPLPDRDVSESIANGVCAPYDALVLAGYATSAPLGNERREYKITPAGRAHLAATRKAT